MAPKDPYQYFRVEARELQEGLSQGVLALERSGASKDAVARLLRLAHTLKGAARVVRLTAVADLAHGVEEALAPLREGGVDLPSGTADALLGLVDGIARCLAALDAPGASRPLASPLPGAGPFLSAIRVGPIPADSPKNLRKTCEMQ